MNSNFHSRKPVDYNHEVTIDIDLYGHRSNDSTCTAFLWIPKECGTLRGFILAQMTLIEKEFTEDPLIRQAAETEKLGIVFLNPGFDALFNYVENNAGKKLQFILQRLAEISNHAEIESVPFLTVGHSTAGVFARNIAYWNPNRVFGIIHIKSGNLEQHIYGHNRSLVGIPFLAINGQFEEHGPIIGIQPDYGLETQWIMMKKQILERRAMNPNNLMSLIVEPGAAHRSWSNNLSQYTALFIRKAAHYKLSENQQYNYEIPEDIQYQDGWLTDSNIKRPKYAPAPYSKYKGDPSKAFWHLDREMAEASMGIHHFESNADSVWDNNMKIILDDEPLSKEEIRQLREESGYQMLNEFTDRMEFRIMINRQVLHILKQQDRQVQSTIKLALSGLSGKPTGDIRKLKGCNGLKRLRINSFRIIFERVAQEKAVFVLSLARD